MTNKEAMAELKAMPIIYPITNGENDRASRLMQARDMAIKALEQEPCKDTISREDALMCLTGEIKETDTIETIIARSGRRIKSLPSVKPQEPCEDADMKLIHTQGLDEGIKCAMCTNSMANDKGCDGGCVVNEVMYKKILDVIRRHIIDGDEL